VGLEGDWNLVEWAEGRQAAKPLISGSKITLTIGQKQPSNTGDYNGFGGCDQYEGTYSLGPGTDDISFLNPTIVPGASACTPEVQNQQTQYLTLLGEVTKYQVDASQRKLTLTTSSGWTLFYERITP
jgi:heat shock protein HslJ